MTGSGRGRMFSTVWVKALAWIGGSLLLATLVIGGLFAWLFIPFVSAPDFPPPADATEAYQQDLRYLAAYADYEKAFDDDARRDAFLARVDEIDRHLEGMTPARFELAVAGAVALADNGHSNVSPVGRTRRVNHFPIRTGPFEDGEFILQTTREQRDLLGAQILAVEGHPIAEVTAAYLKYFGGVERRARFFTHMFIISPALLHAEGFSAAPDAAVLTLRLSNGDVIERRLEGIDPVNSARAPFGRETMDYRVPATDQDGWVHLMAGQQPPLSLEEPDEPYLYRYLEDKGGAYVRINFNADVEGRSLSGWLASVADELVSRRPAFAVVDLRFNGGGTDATADFAKRLPSLVEGDGRIYILTSHETFSAAIAAAAQFKIAAGKRARVVGSEAGDRLRFVGNGGELYYLPNSRIALSIWSAWEDYHDGCYDWTECFWLSPFFLKPGVDTLVPDIAVSTNFSDYAVKRDRLLEAALTDATSN